MAIFMALLIGAGAAYGYYVYSTPKLPAGISQPPAASPTAAPTVSPTAAPTKTATGLRSAPQQPAYTFVVAPALPRV